MISGRETLIADPIGGADLRHALRQSRRGSKAQEEEKRCDGQVPMRSAES